MKILLLGGTKEARHLAPRLQDLGHQVTVSLAGVTQSPQAYGTPTRSGGFGGVKGLVAWMRAQQTQALIDATHPFADQMPWHATEAARTLTLPRLRLCRPAWTVLPHWYAHGSLAEIVATLPKGARVLATTGQDNLAPYAERDDVSVWLRTIEDPGPLPEHISVIQARPPFSRADEAKLLRAHQITHLTTKNSGGAAAKLDAADREGVEIHLIDRPSPPPGPVVDSVEAAVAWLAQTVASDP